MPTLNEILNSIGGVGRNQGDQQGAGPGGICKCTKCGYEMEHKTGQPCNEIKCPKCGEQMTRKPPEEEKSTEEQQAPTT